MRRDTAKRKIITTEKGSLNMRHVRGELKMFFKLGFATALTLAPLLEVRAQLVTQFGPRLSKPQEAFAEQVGGANSSNAAGAAAQYKESLYVTTLYTFYQRKGILGPSGLPVQPPTHPHFTPAYWVAAPDIAVEPPVNSITDLIMRVLPEDPKVMRVTRKLDEGKEVRVYKDLVFSEPITFISNPLSELDSPFVFVATGKKVFFAPRTWRHLYLSNAAVPYLPLLGIEVPEGFSITSLESISLKGKLSDASQLVQGLDSHLTVFDGDYVIEFKNLSTGETMKKLFSRENFVKSMMPAAGYWMARVSLSGFSTPTLTLKERAPAYDLLPEESVAETAFRNFQVMASEMAGMEEGLRAEAKRVIANANASNSASENAQVAAAALMLDQITQASPKVAGAVADIVPVLKDLAGAPGGARDSLTVEEVHNLSHVYSPKVLLKESQQSALGKAIARTSSPSQRMVAAANQSVRSTLSFLMKPLSSQVVGRASAAMISTGMSLFGPKGRLVLGGASVLSAAVYGSAYLNVGPEVVSERVSLMVTSLFHHLNSSEVSQVLQVNLTGWSEAAASFIVKTRNFGVESYLSVAAVVMASIGFLPLVMYATSLPKMFDVYGNQIKDVGQKFVTVGQRLLTAAARSIRVHVMENLLHQKNFYPIIQERRGNPFKPLPGDTSGFQGFNWPTAKAAQQKAVKIQDRYAVIDAVARPLANGMAAHATTFANSEQGVELVLALLVESARNNIDPATLIQASQLTGQVMQSQAFITLLKEPGSTHKMSAMVAKFLTGNAENQRLFEQAVPLVEAALVTFIGKIADERARATGQEKVITLEDFDEHKFRFYQENFKALADQIKEAADEGIWQNLRSRMAQMKTYLSRKVIAETVFGNAQREFHLSRQGISVSKSVADHWRESNFKDYIYSFIAAGMMYPVEHLYTFKLLTFNAAELSSQQAADGAVNISAPVEQTIILGSLLVMAAISGAVKNVILSDGVLKSELVELWNLGNRPMSSFLSKEKREEFKGQVHRVYNQLANTFSGIPDGELNADNFVPKGRPMGVKENAKAFGRSVAVTPQPDPVHGNALHGVQGFERSTKAYTEYVKSFFGGARSAYVRLMAPAFMFGMYYTLVAKGFDFEGTGEMQSAFFIAYASYMMVMTLRMLKYSFVGVAGFAVGIPFFHFAKNFVDKLVEMNLDLMTGIQRRFEKAFEDYKNNPESKQAKEMWTEEVYRLRGIYEATGEALPSELNRNPESMTLEEVKRLAIFDQTHPALATRDNKLFGNLSIVIFYTGVTTFLYYLNVQVIHGIIDTLLTFGLMASHYHLVNNLFTMAAALAASMFAARFIVPGMVLHLSRWFTRLKDQVKDSVNESARTSESAIGPKNQGGEYAGGEPVSSTPLKTRQQRLREGALKVAANFDSLPSETRMYILGQLGVLLDKSSSPQMDALESGYERIRQKLGLAPGPHSEAGAVGANLGGRGEPKASSIRPGQQSPCWAL